MKLTCVLLLPIIFLSYTHCSDPKSSFLSNMASHFSNYICTDIDMLLPKNDDVCVMEDDTDMSVNLCDQWPFVICDKNDIPIAVVMSSKQAAQRISTSNNEITTLGDAFIFSKTLPNLARRVVPKEQ